MHRASVENLQGLARGSVVAAVVLAPWLFGSADPWAYLLICLLVGIGVAAWLLSLVLNPRPRLRSPRLTLALVLLLALVVLQILPLPSSLVRVLSPVSAESQAARAQLFQEVGAQEFLPAGMKDHPGWATLSTAPSATRRSLYLLCAYIGVFLVFANAFTGWRQIRNAAWAVVVSSFAMAVVGIIHKLSGSQEMLWFHTPRFGGAIFGPFTNPNHYAQYMNMAFGVTLGLLLVAGNRSGLRNADTWREKLGWFASDQAGRFALLSFAAVIMAASVCVSLSSGGMMSLAVALGVATVVVSLWRGVSVNRGRLIVAVVFLAVAAVVWIGWKPVFKELGTLREIDISSNVRTEATLSTLRMFAASPAFGVGFGSFQHVFPAFQGPRIEFGTRWLHAHNDYAQLLAEGGIVGVLLVGLLVFLFVQTLRRRLPGATTTGKLFVAGLVVGMMAVALHSFVDYGLHKPANAFLLAALFGLAHSAAGLRSNRSESRQQTKREIPREPAAALPRLLVRLGALVALAGLLVLVVGELGELRGELAFARFYRLALVAEKSQDPTDLRAAVEGASREAELVMRYSAGNPDALWEVTVSSLIWSAQGSLEPLLRLRLAERSVRAAALATRAAPSDYETWLWFARTQDALALGPPAEKCLDRARELAPPGAELELLPSAE